MASTTTNPLDQTDADVQALADFNRIFRRMDAKHDKRCSAYDRRHEIYRGEYKVTDKGNEWLAQLNPPEAFQCVETLFVNLLDDQPTPRVNPRGPESVDGAPVMEEILEEHRSKDERAAKESPWIKQALVMGASPAKMSWKYSHREQRKTKWILQPDGTYDKQRVKEQRCQWDQPTFTNIRIHDFWWDPSVSSFSDSPTCAHRTYTTISHLREWAQEIDEETGKPLYKNIDLVSQNDRGVPLPSGGMFVPDTTGKVELIELEIPGRDRFITVANRTVVIRDSSYPFDHGELSFAMLTTQPDLYRVDGFSEVEHLEDLQLAAWAALNQMIDGAKFVANPMIVTNHPDEVLKQGRVFPGGVFKGNLGQDFATWQPDIRFMDVLTKVRVDIEGMMEQATGATPALSGAGPSDGVDKTTATEFYGNQQQASKRLLAKRNMLGQARERLGRQEIALEQQCLDKPVKVPVKGVKNEWQWRYPHELVGEFDYKIDDAGESLNQAQRRAEAQLLLTLLTSPPFLQVLMQAGQRIKVDEILDFLADAFERPDIPQWVEPIPAPPVQVPGPLSGGGVGPLAGGPVSPGNPVNATPLGPAPGRQGPPTPLSPPPLPAAA